MSIFRRYPAALLTVGLALFFNVLHYLAETRLQAEPGSSGYWYTSTVENLQSEMWQVAWAAFCFEHWKWWHSPEANEDAPNSKGALIVPIAIVAIFILLYLSVLSARPGFNLR